jgi:hypothetical protein
MHHIFRKFDREQESIIIRNLPSRSSCLSDVRAAKAGTILLIPSSLILLSGISKIIIKIDPQHSQFIKIKQTHVQPTRETTKWDQLTSQIKYPKLWKLDQ